MNAISYSNGEKYTRHKCRNKANNSQFNEISQEEGKQSEYTHTFHPISKESFQSRSSSERKNSIRERKKEDNSCNNSNKKCSEKILHFLSIYSMHLDAFQFFAQLRFYLHIFCAVVVFVGSSFFCCCIEFVFG